MITSGIQCRTMLSQRPCGSTQCTREECSRARLSASVIATIPDTENGVTGSESVPQTTGESESLYTLHSLTRDDVDLLRYALSVVHAESMAGTDEWKHSLDLEMRLPL